jgi:hypothetical protein
MIFKAHIELQPWLWSFVKDQGKTQKGLQQPARLLIDFEPVVWVQILVGALQSLS